MGTIATKRANRSDLDSWPGQPEALGELKRMKAEVDADPEMAAITYPCRQPKEPGAAV